LACYHQNNQVPIATVTNTAGDTWTKTTHTPFNPTGGRELELWYVLATAGAVNDIVTVTFSQSEGYCGLGCYEFHPTAAASFVADGTDSQAAAQFSIPLTLTGSGCVVMLGFSANQDETGSNMTKTALDSSTSTAFIWGYEKDALSAGT